MKKVMCHKASNGNHWMICCACDGRIHLQECTSKRRKSVDCCPERHKMLFDQGQVTGIHDSAVLMLGSSSPLGGGK